MLTESIRQQIEVAARIVRKGGTVAFPTETVYGLGADAFNPKAVARIFSAKQRPRFDPLIVHIHAPTQLDWIARDIPDNARKLVEKFWPGPLTIIVPKKESVPDIVTSGLPNVGIRMPDNEIALELIQPSQTVLAAPSANKFGRLSPTCAEHVREQLREEVSMILDGGPCTVGVESTIVSFAETQPLLLRPGGTALEDIQSVIGDVHVPPKGSLTKASSGRQLRHYAPRTPLAVGAASLALPGLRKGLISFSPPSLPIQRKYVAVETLSAKGNLEEAAANLFSALHRLDNMNLDIIVTSSFPDHGLGITINDRLGRASQSRKKDA